MVWVFGWLGWCLVLCLVGGEILRKIFFTVLIWLFVCSPVMAFGTTDSALVFSDSITYESSMRYMVKSAVLSGATVKLGFGRYDFVNDVFYSNTLVSLPQSFSVPENKPYWLSAYAFSYDTAEPFFSMKVELSNLSLTKGDSLSFILNRFLFYFASNEISFYKGLNPSTLSPVSTLVKYEWEGTGKSGSSFVPLSGTRYTSLDFSLQNSSTAYLSDGGQGQHFNGFACSDVVMSFTADIPDTVTTTQGNTFEVTSATVTSVTLCSAFPLSSQNFGLFPDLIFPDGASCYLRPVFSYAGGQPLFYLRNQQVLTDSTSSMFASLNQSLSSLSTTLTNRIDGVKTTVQQGANEVKNEIKSQTQILTDKLTSVKDDIVGGITDLKDTVTKGFGDVVQGITDLPGKIGEMLQGLIVPDSEKVSGKFEEFNDLAEEKLGVIYQVPEMVISMAQSIVSGTVEQKGEMTLPKFEIIMPATTQSRSGEVLTVWEEYTFPIWPEGTEVIHTAVQTATSMICVLAMINSLKRKYEDWLDGK